MRARLAVATLTVALLSSCGGDEPTVKAPKPAPPPSSIEAPSPTPSGSESPLDFPSVATGIDKVLVVVVENKSYSQMKARAPRIWALAEEYGYATDFRAIVHPSLPNYIVMASGSTLGVRRNDFPRSIRLRQPSVFGNTVKAGGTAKIWADSMGSRNCRPNNYGKYVPRHVPWTYYVNERDLCEKFVVDAGEFAGDVAAGDLATVGMLIPDNCHNSHDCSIPTADDWIADRVEVAMSGPDWKTGRLLIIVTADEDDHNEGNRILTAVIHPSQKSNVVTRPLTLYSLHRLLADIGKTEPMNKGRNAPDMAKAFGLPIA